MNEEYRYLNDEELKVLIVNVENNGMIAPPVYLKDQIMNEILQSGQKSESLPSVGKVAQISCMERKKAADRQFFLYSMKIVAAAATALFCLTSIPMNPTVGLVNYSQNDRIEQQIEKDMDRYRQEDEELLKRSEDGNYGISDFINKGLGLDGSGKVAQIINSFSNEINMEEENYD